VSAVELAAAVVLVGIVAFVAAFTGTAP